MSDRSTETALEKALMSKTMTAMGLAVWLAATVHFTALFVSAATDRLHADSITACK